MGKKESGLGIFTSIMNKNIRFNPRPWSNSTSISSKKIEVKEWKFIDLHAEVAGEVDALIAANEKELSPEELDLNLAGKTVLDTKNMLIDELIKNGQ